MEIIGVMIKSILKIGVSLIIGFVLLAIVGTQSAASEGREIEYEKINTLLSTVSQSKSPLIESQVKLEILSKEISYDEIKVWIVEDNQILNEIPVDLTNGTIKLPVFKEARAKQLALRLNQDKDSLVLNLNASIKSPSSTVMSYRDLFLIIEDFNNVTKKLAGAMYLFAPKMSSLKFRFDQPATIEIPVNKKNYRYETDTDLVIEAKISSRLMKENPTVTFSVIPASIEPID